jgi:ATP-binding cassette subfamily B protein
VSATATRDRATTPAGAGIHTDSRESARSVLGRGVALSPELARGLPVTLLLALLSTAGRVLVPVAVQQTIDRGIRGAAGPRPGLVLMLTGVAALGLVVTTVAAFAANRRIFRSTEAGLATLRTKAFRHVHDLSVLSQNTEQRGALVARVTTDVDTISTFVQWGGLLLVTSAGQLLVATVLMAIYSWPLALLVWICFLPLLLGFRVLQRIVSRAYAQVRERVGEMLGAVSESVVGADTIRAYAVERRTQERIDTAVQAHASSAIRAQRMVALSFSSGVLVSGLVVAAVVGVGTWLGVAGRLTLGELIAFLFLVQLFTGPVQIGTEVLNELQNAAAGWRRVLAVLDTPADVADPGERGVELPRGPISVRFDHVRFAYPGGPEVLRDVDLDLPPRVRVAVVGETGSGKTTLAKLLTRLMDPTGGRVLVDGVDLRDVRFSSLRERVVLVPQEGFLVDDTLRANIAWGREHRGDPHTSLDAAGRDQVVLALTELGLLQWAEQLPHGLDTQVGQRGESLSAGERQLVALARAYLADPDLLVLDEATSAVDPATEVRLQRALDGATRGRTSVAIAHRLSTAEAADLVVVVEAGEVVDVGPHRDLVQRSPVYRRLHASWAAQQRPGAAAGAAPPRADGRIDA